MAHVQKKRRTMALVLLVFAFFFSGFIQANADYKIISYQGKVKLKNSEGVKQLKKELHVYLKKSDAVMLYPGAAIEVLFPDGKKKRFSGPFYSTVENLNKIIAREELSYLGKTQLWKAISRMFDEEGEESAGTTKGTQEDSLNFYHEISPVLAEVRIEDKIPSVGKEKELEKMLDAVQYGFNAFPEGKQIVIRSVIYKSFGLYKTALNEIFAKYKGILYTKGKQAERELIEDYLFNEFLPIVISVLPNDRKEELPKGKSNSLDFQFNKTFYSNFRLWWAAFYFDGEKLETIEKTIDHSLYPENTFKVSKKIAVNNNRTKNASLPEYPCFFIVACADWTELEKFDKIEYAKEALLKDGIDEIPLQSIQEYGKVIIKKCL